MPPATPATPANNPGLAATDHLAGEIAAEQRHVDRVYAEIAKAAVRADAVAADGHARGRTERLGEIRYEDMTGLVERDALVHHAARRRQAIDSQHEGLVFGRLDLQPPGSSNAGAGEREARYIGRLGVRDDDYEPLVIDWRAPAAGAFYRATPVEPMGVLRRRVLRCRGSQVVGVEDDLMVADPPDDLVVVGDGALMAALTRARGSAMADIVATIQAHQDEAIRAPSRGITEITGGPGTGKTVVALHRAAYLLYSERRRYERGGILAVGPSAAYTAYIERVLPSLGEDSVVLRSLGDLVDAVTTGRLDPPAAAAIKGSLRMRTVLSRAARAAAPDAPTQLRTFIAGDAIRLEAAALEGIRTRVLRSHPRNLGTAAARAQIGDAAWAQVRTGERTDFNEAFTDHLAVDEFMAAWWPQVDPREVVLWLADPQRLAGFAHGVLSASEQEIVVGSMQTALRRGVWSVADTALIDEVALAVGPVQADAAEQESWFAIDELDDLSGHGVQEVSVGGSRARSAAYRPAYDVTATDPVERLLAGTVGKPREFAHLLVDEAQDLSPMQWRMLGRRGRHASWTVVGDAAQSSWPELAEAARARVEAYAGQPVQVFHMDTNYRNAQEIFRYAERVIREVVPDADIPRAVRETGVDPVELPMPGDLTGVLHAVGAAVADLADQVDGSIAVISSQRWLVPLAEHLDAAWGRPEPSRVVVLDPMSTKGLEWDATVVVDLPAIVDESPGGARVLYVALTRAAHRMTVLR